MFELHPTLDQDTTFVGKFELCRVLLSRDSNYPWCILVPEREGIEEIYQLPACDRTLLIEESCMLAELMTNLYAPCKMNIATLGNVVPQLHIHHVARYQHDAAWPGPVWGKVPPVPYDAAAFETRVNILSDTLTAWGSD